MTPDELNEACVQGLVAATLDQRVVVVGSGPSSPYIAPIWRLEELLCARCGLDKGKTEEFWDFTERAHVANPGRYFETLRETYKDTPHWTSRVYRHLMSIPFQGYATLNYDDQLPSEFQQKYPDSFADYFSVFPPKENQTYWAPQEFLDPPPRLIALHGYADPECADWEEQVILRRSDYNQHYVYHPASLLHWWSNMLLAIPCLFVGTSLKEPGLLRVVERLLRQHSARLVKMDHLHLVSTTPDDNGIYEAAGVSLSVIRQLQYDPKDSRHTGLLEVLSSFSHLPAEPPTPRAPAPLPITATEALDFT